MSLLVMSAEVEDDVLSKQVSIVAEALKYTVRRALTSHLNAARSQRSRLKERETALDLKMGHVVNGCYKDNPNANV